MCTRKAHHHRCGDPNAYVSLGDGTAEVHLPGGHVGLLDVVDIPRVRRYRRYRHTSPRPPTPSIFARSGRGRVFMHRLILGATPRERVRHMDGDGLNNCRYNLRICAAGQRAQLHRGHGPRRGRPSVFFDSRLVAEDTEDEDRP